MTNGVKSVNIFGELDRLKVQWTAMGGDEIRLCCPVHEDSSPSACLNVKDHVWKCFVPSCAASGDFISLLAYIQKQPRALTLADLQKRYPDIAGVSSIPSQTVEKFHANLKAAGPLLGELHKRGVTDEMMRVARLGFHDGRITIPVYDAGFNCLNVRRYLPGAPGPQKMRNTTGHGTPTLYRAETLRGYEKVVVCGGEMKALVTGELLKDKEFAAVCSTGGEGHWKEEWTEQLAGKDIWVCLDVDDAGVAGSRAIAMAIYGKARSVRVVTLPLDKEKFPKGDVNDWVGQCGATADDLLTLLEGTAQWTPPSKQVAPTNREPRKCSLEQAISASSVGEVIEVDAVVAAADQTPFLVPREVDIECTRDQPGCSVCPVKLSAVEQTGWTKMTVDPGAPAILGMLGSNDREQRERISESLGIPSCKVVKFTARSHHVVHDVRLSPPIDLSGGRVGDSWYPAVIVGERAPELNVPCRMRGTIHPHPKTQQAVALISSADELEDTLSTFSCTDEELAELRQFTPAKNTIQALNERMNEIADDLAANVTWIYERRQLHVALDLAFHSVLLFDLSGRQVNGWLNLLVIGDSSQGKSECTARLMTFYSLGDKVDCKNATVAGLLGGLEQLGNRWFVRWGAIPRRDRMLVALEELKGASTEVLSKLTEMRSSGIAEIPKIERRRSLARTRLVMISNPRSPRPMASFHFGVEAVIELIGSLEDVRRFDLAIALGKDEVSDEVINARTRKPHRRVASQAAYRKLVLWAWTRSSSQVRVSEDAVAAVSVAAQRLTAKYSEAIPLVDKGSVRLKLARLAVAVAARTFSSPDGVHLDVGSHHVSFAARLVDEAYSSKAMGYDEFSAAQHLMSTVQDPDVVKKTIRSTKFPHDLASVMLRRDTISIDDIQSAAALDYDDARSLLSLFVRKGALIRTSRSEYAKNPQFIDILKDIRSTPASKDQHDTKGDEF